MCKKCGCCNCCCWLCGFCGLFGRKNKIDKNEYIQLKNTFTSINIDSVELKKKDKDKETNIKEINIKIKQRRMIKSVGRESFRDFKSIEKEMQKKLESKYNFSIDDNLNIKAPKDQIWLVITDDRRLRFYNDLIFNQIESAKPEIRQFKQKDFYIFKFNTENATFVLALLEGININPKEFKTKKHSIN